MKILHTLFFYNGSWSLCITEREEYSQALWLYRIPIHHCLFPPFRWFLQQKWDDRKEKNTRYHIFLNIAPNNLVNFWTPYDSNHCLERSLFRPIIVSGPVLKPESKEKDLSVQRNEIFWATFPGIVSHSAKHACNSEQHFVLNECRVENVVRSCLRDLALIFSKLKIYTCQWRHMNTRASHNYGQTSLADCSSPE